MKRSTIFSLCIVALCILTIVFFILQANSERIALNQANIDKGYYHEVVELGINIDQEYKIIASVTKDGNPVMIKLVKNPLGFWKIEQMHAVLPDYIALMGWGSFQGFKRYDPEDTPHSDFEHHFGFCGNNAIKLINIPSEMIPDGVILTVHQVGSFYSIHATSYSDKQINSLHISDILKELGCIP